MARSVTVERQITHVSSDASPVDPAVLPIRRCWCRSGGDEIIPGLSMLAAMVHAPEVRATAVALQRRGFSTSLHHSLLPTTRGHCSRVQVESAHWTSRVWSLVSTNPTFAADAGRSLEVHLFTFNPTLATRHVSNINQAARRWAKRKGDLPHRHGA
jgi:hypothetical protein